MPLSIFLLTIHRSDIKNSIENLKDETYILFTKTTKIMKTKLFIPMALLCIFSLTSNAAEKEVNSISKTEKAGNSSVAAKVLMDRLHEIQALTKKDLSNSERSSLKKEVRGIKEELKTMDGGIYISAGALILILILIIIL